MTVLFGGEVDERYILVSLLQDWTTEFQHVFVERSCVLKAFIPRLDQQGMLEFNSTQWPSSADEPGEDPLYCCLFVR